MNTSRIVTEMKKYSSLLETALTLPLNFEPTAESASSLQVERGILFPAALWHPSAPPFDCVQRPIDLAAAGKIPPIEIIDRAGHHRPVYRPLLIYAWAQSMNLLYESLPREEFARWQQALRTWSENLETAMESMEWPPGPLPAQHGDQIAAVAWSALALHTTGKLLARDAWLNQAADIFGHLRQRQQPLGQFLLAQPRDNPEPLTYHELVILHAAASYAVQTEDRPLSLSVANNARYHLNQTQPDHATTQPWALFAFIWDRDSQPLADQLLHTAGIQHPGTCDGLSLMLLADALYCLRLFL